MRAPLSMKGVSALMRGFVIALVSYALLGGMCFSAQASTMAFEQHGMMTVQECIACPASLASHLAISHHQLTISPSIPEIIAIIFFAFIATGSIAFLFISRTTRSLHKDRRYSPWRTYLERLFSVGILNPKCA